MAFIGWFIIRQIRVSLILIVIIGFVVNNIFMTPELRTPQHTEVPALRGKELFPPATAYQQIKACFISVKSALQMGYLKTNEQKEAKLKELASVLEMAYSSNDCRNSEDIASKAVALSSMLLGSTFIDEMDGNVGYRLFGRSSYGREKGISVGGVRRGMIDINFGRLPLLQKHHYMTAGEQEYLLDQLRKVDEYVQLHTVEDFKREYAKNPKARFVVAEPIPYIEMSKMIRAAGKDFPGQLVVPVRFGPRAGGMLIFRQYKATKYNYLGLLSEIPRPEVWRASLEAGVPIYRDSNEKFSENPSFADMSAGEIEKKLKELTDFGTYHTMKPGEASEARRTSIVAKMLMEHDTQKAEQLLSRHKAFYKRSYGFEHPIFGQADMTLTRSGVSANEAAIYAILQDRENGLKLPSYTMPGWYFENRNEIRRFFSQQTDPAEAQAFFINAEPNVPVWGQLGERDYKIERNKLVENVITRAKETPSKKYYIVLDKTTDLLWKPFEGRNDLPKNLVIIETASLTKHQRGERKYFFGAMWTYGPKEIQKKIDDVMVHVRGALTTDAIGYVPRIRPSEVAQNLATIKEKQEAFTRGMQEAQEGLPDEYRWTLDHHNYFSYTKPPYDAVLKRFVELAPEEVGQKVQDDKKQHIPSQFHDLINDEDVSDVLDNYLESYADTSTRMAAGGLYGDGKPYPEGVQPGDSFGLNVTRLCYIKHVLENPLDGKYMQLSTSRFSFGYKTPQEVLYERGKHFGGAIKARMIYLQSRKDIENIKERGNGKKLKSNVSAVKSIEGKAGEESKAVAG